MKHIYIVKTATEKDCSVCWQIPNTAIGFYNKVYAQICLKHIHEQIGDEVAHHAWIEEVEVYDKQAFVQFEERGG